MTRRDLLAGSVAAGALLHVRPGFAKASQPATAVSSDIPPHACDTHTHIYGDPKRFPLWSGRPYTPEPALPEEMAALHRALHVERVVIVTPSAYGTDNEQAVKTLQSDSGSVSASRFNPGCAVIEDFPIERAAVR
jgi:hypothetical protein